jgi:membrane peptidoglycan carboxypeptidase
MSAQKPLPSGALGAFGAFVGMSVIAGLLVTAAVTPAIAVTGMAAQSTIGIFEGLPEYLAVDQLAQPTTIYAKDSKGADFQLATFYAQNRQSDTWDQISPNVKNAAIAGEDPRFYQHGGVDLQGTLRAIVLTTLKKAGQGGSVQGGSSITQQYVKNVLLQVCETKPVSTAAQKTAYQSCVDDATGVSPDRKLREMKYAVGLEKKYTKDQILLGYLNIAGFGGSVYGIESAAKYYYGVTAKDLTIAQSASLLAIVNNPSLLKLDDPTSKVNGAANGYKANKIRRDYILGKMRDTKKITPAEYTEAVKTVITPKITPTVRGCQTAGGSAYFCDYVQKIALNDPVFGATADDRVFNFNRGGYKIYTTLDLDLQMTAEAALKARVPSTFAKADLGGAAVGVQPATGRVLFMTQSKNYSQDPSVLTADPSYTAVNWNTDLAYGGSSGFQVGSSYKAFTLNEWLKTGHSLQETVDASVTHYNQSSFTDSCGGPWTGVYDPKNDAAGEGGIQSAINATAQSINTAFVAMAHQMDLCNIKADAEAFMVHRADGQPLDSRPSSVLGTNQIAPLTLATAYAGIANGGVVCSPVAIDKIVDASGKDVAPPKSTCKVATDPKIAAAMAYALKQVVTRGTAAGSNPTKLDVLGKTGTTDNAEQIWITEASTKVAATYWIGNVTGHVSMRKTTVNGMTASLTRTPLMRQIMGTALAKYGGDPFPAPGSALLYGVQVTVPDLTGKSPADAQTLLKGIGLNYQDGGPIASSQAAGTVAATNPAAGSSVSKGASITVNTSDGSIVMTTIPDVRGETENKATSDLKGAGFQVTVVKDPASPSVGKVTAMSPAAGTSAQKGSVVTITVGGP